MNLINQQRFTQSTTPLSTGAPCGGRCRAPTPPRRQTTTTTICQASGGRIMREVLTNSERMKLNTATDRQWYSSPRLVQHSDNSFRRQVTSLYRQTIPQGGAVLDLCSSWVSHLPSDVQYSTVVGHGLNAAELAENRRLDRFFVRDLNAEPDGWALADGSFDAVLCCCSVQYMQQPECVFAEIYRVLKPGGVCIVTFTNRLFYEKAIAAWRDASMYSREQLVKQYFLAVDGWTEPQSIRKVEDDGVGKSQQLNPFEAAAQALENFLGRGGGDPFHAVVAYKDFVKTR